MVLTSLIPDVWKEAGSKAAPYSWCFRSMTRDGSGARSVSECSFSHVTLLHLSPAGAHSIGSGNGGPGGKKMFLLNGRMIGENLLIRFINQLPVKDVARCSLVCREWRALLKKVGWISLCPLVLTLGWKQRMQPRIAFQLDPDRQTQCARSTPA